jgi:glycosyltransferase involved in cell wall biosynthesis
VVLVVHSADLGGAERQALLLARELVRTRLARVAMCALGSEAGNALLADCRWAGVPLTVLATAPEPRGKVDVARRLLLLTRALRRLRPDVIVAYTATPNVLCGLVWRLTGARMFVWSQRDPGQGLDDRVAHRAALRLTPRFISNSEHGRDFLLRRFGVPSERVAVIPNGVGLEPPQADRATWRARLGADETDLVATMIGHLALRKDHATLISAWPGVETALRQRGRRAFLALAGRVDRGHEHLVALAARAGVADRVHFLGSVSDVAGLLGASDMAILSSHAEGLPNGVLEAMAAGLAVVATNLPGVREALGPAAVPWLCAPGDAIGLVRRVVDLAEDPVLARSLGEANRYRAESLFSPRRMVEASARWIGLG